MTVYCFLGPSLPAERAACVAGSGAVLRGPIRHGDLLGLDIGEGDTLAIVDGVFHSDAAVRHKEILDALSRGARVIGGGSMGALRAAETRRFGMLGVGRVYDLFAGGLLTSDDEVALVHRDEEAGYRPLSIALVSVREAGRELVRRGCLGQQQLDALTGMLGRMFYMERGLHRVREAALVAGIRDHALTELLHMVDGSVPDVKACDAELVLEAALAPCVAATAEVPDPWETDNVSLWRNTFALQVSMPGPLAGRLVMRALQLLDPTFPQLYEDVVREQLARAWGTDTSRASIAAEFARRTGIESACEPVGEQWLYPWPIGRDIDGLVRLAVATYREQPNLPPWDALTERVARSGDELAPVWEACQVTVRRNSEAAAGGAAGGRPELAPAATTLPWVADLWGVPSNIDVLRRVGYIRGFRDAQEIYEVARKFLVLMQDRDVLALLRDQGWSAATLATGGSGRGGARVVNVMDRPAASCRDS
jgi:hypothetical protein